MLFMPSCNSQRAHVPHLCVVCERHWIELWWSDSDGSPAPGSISGKSSLHYLLHVRILLLLSASSSSSSSSSSIWVTSSVIIMGLAVKMGSQLKYPTQYWWLESRMPWIFIHDHRQETQVVILGCKHSTVKESRLSTRRRTHLILLMTRQGRNQLKVFFTLIIIIDWICTALF